jgi:hypothetical protein
MLQDGGREPARTGDVAQLTDGQVRVRPAGAVSMDDGFEPAAFQVTGVLTRS